MTETPAQKVTHKRRSMVGAFVGLAVGVIVVGMIVVVVQTLGLVSAIREQQKTNTSTNQAILSCTTPDGKCFKDGQLRTATAVGDIGRISVYAAACADLPAVQGAEEIEECVTRLLAASDSD